MSTATETKPDRPRIARFIRTLAIPIILAWIAIIAVLNTVVPQLEEVGKLRAVSMSPNDAPSMIAVKKVGTVFDEYNTSSSVMIVLEGDRPLGADAHAFYDKMVSDLRADTTHVQHVQDFWGDTLTAKGAQSRDGKAAYVQVYIAGDQGETLANESVAAARKAIEDTPAPPGVQAYVTGPAALTHDTHVIGNESLGKITLFTLAAIACAAVDGVVILDAEAWLGIRAIRIQRFQRGAVLEQRRRAVLFGVEGELDARAAGVGVAEQEGRADGAGRQSSEGGQAERDMAQASPKHRTVSSA